MILTFTLHTVIIILTTKATNSDGRNFEFTSISDKNYHHCPTALEIENSKPEEFLDIEYLDGLCKNVVSVTRMKISGNFFGIAESLFQKLPKLEDFQATDIENLTELTIGTWNLKFLDLSSNNIEKISIEFMDELMTLNLSNNQLTDDSIIMTSTRPPLSLKLKILDLSHNKIAKLDLLLPFWNLRKFMLNDNQITHIQPGIIQRYPNLITLNLANNRLIELPDGIFTGMIHLVNLDLSYNKLTEARSGIINSLRGLEFLDMVGNNITNFKYEELDHPLEVLRVDEQNIYIHGNRINMKRKEKESDPTTSTTEISSMLTYLE